MLIGNALCRCCNGGALSLKLMMGINEIEELLPEHYQLIIHSGYRCRKHNASLKNASPNSQHLYGNALDFHCPDLDIMSLLYVVMQIPVFAKGGIGLYLGEDEWLHIDVRQQSSRWCYIDGAKASFDKMAESVLIT